VLSAGGNGEPEQGEDTGESTFITRLSALDARTLALARLGAERATRAETRVYAEQAVVMLTRELEELDSAHELIYGEPPAARGKAKPPSLAGGDFDRAFIDALIASHREAIRIAEREVYRDEDPDLMEVAEKAMDQRTPQVASMNRFREDAFGSPAPGAGTP
jgi:uncharacterized protein (DUF305 family)